MHTPRLYTPQTLTAQKQVTVSGQAAHHIAHVLRLTAGAMVHLFDGRGSEHRATITTVNRSSITFTVNETVHNEVESVVHITLLQGIARTDHMDLILQKAVELGVSTIQPLWTARSQHHLKGSRLEKRTRHWQGVIISACEQCGRNIVPELFPAMPLAEQLISVQADGNCLLLDPESKTRPGDIHPEGNSFHLLIGPEGGLTRDEQQLARENGFTGIHLGPRILRTETAAFAAISCIQTLWGDFS